MKQKLNSILKIGINPKTDSFHAFIIYSLNFIALFGLAASLSSIAVDGLYKRMDVGIPVASSILIFSSILFFNAKNKYGVSKFFLFALFPLVQYYNLSYVEPKNIGIVLTIIPLIFVTPLGIVHKGIRMLTICYLFFLCFILLKDHLSPLGVPFFFNLAVAVCVLLIGIHIILNQFHKYSKSLNQHNKKLKSQNRELQNLIDQNDHKTELLGILSHDLKGPAASFDELSKKVAYLIKKERFDELQKFGDYFAIAGDKIFQNIDRLLNWTISQKKNIIAAEDNFSPFELIDEISQKLKLLNADKSLQINNNIPKNLMLKTDERILEIILQNLLSNAINNSPDKESIDIKSESSQDGIVTSITNKGPAMDMKLVELAEAGKFRKSHAGHGLGLGICFSLIKFLEGNIIYETDNLVGTTVKVSIPFEKSIEN